MPQPRFRMCILYVDEHESVQRQLSRGRKALEHNKQVDECGEGEYVEVRETDLSVKAAKQRYRLFVEGTMAANEGPVVVPAVRGAAGCGGGGRRCNNAAKSIPGRRVGGVKGSTPLELPQ